VVHNIPAAAPQSATTPVGNMWPGDFHLFGNLKKGPGWKDMKQAVTSWLESLLGYKPGCPSDKGVYVSGDYVEAWCVSSAAPVLCINLSHNKVLSISVFVTLFSETSSNRIMIKMSMHK
jgi:hypothetical protein